jgi:hypothetical protein
VYVKRRGSLTPFGVGAVTLWLHTPRSTWQSRFAILSASREHAVAVLELAKESMLEHANSA